MKLYNRIFFFSLLVVSTIGEPIMTFAEPDAIYRLFNRKADHFYTSNCQDLSNAMNLHKYATEGIVGFIEPTQTEGTTPFYRLSRSGNHFYTANGNERDAAIKAGYRDEGIIGYLKPVGDSQTKALYRSFNAKSGDHFYTPSKEEHNKAISQEGYKDEGIAGYIWNSGKYCPLVPPSASAPPTGCRWVNDGEHRPFLEC